jgi:hypothetical protein
MKASKAGHSQLLRQWHPAQAFRDDDVMELSMILQKPA